MANLTLKQLIEELVQQELTEFNAVGAGGVSATGGSPLGMDMTNQHKTLWSGDKKEKNEAVVRGHMSDGPLGNFEDQTNNQKIAMKPKGLWYDIDGAWVRWVQAEMPEWMGDSHYELELDMSKILHMSTPEELQRFTKEYGKQIRDTFSEVFDLIDWPRVAREYSGIEISPYVQSMRNKLIWYHGWDIASGCIWRKDAIKSIKDVSAEKKQQITVSEANSISIGGASLSVNGNSGSPGALGGIGGDEGGVDSGDIGDENFNNVGERQNHKSQLQKFMWSGDVPGSQPPKIRYIAETIMTQKAGIPIPQSEQEQDYLNPDHKELVQEIIENVLDKMGLNKATDSVRRNMIGGGAVYMDRHDSNQERTKEVMGKVSKNLHRKPYSHHPPMTGVGLGEGIVKRLQENNMVLLEAAIDTEIQRAQKEKLLLLKYALEFLKAKQLKPKYIPWVTKQLRNNEGFFDSHYDDEPDENSISIAQGKAERYFEALQGFDKLLTLNQLPQGLKDINRLQNIQDVEDAVEVYHQQYIDKSAAKNAKKDTNKVYEDENYLILEPRSEAASCAYGKGSQWCISATQSKNYFEEYHTQGARFLFLINKKTDDKDAIAFAGNINQIEIYDAQDNTQTVAYIEKKYPRQILKVLNQFLTPIIGMSPFVDISPDDVKSNPQMFLTTEYKSRFPQIVQNHPEFALNVIDVLSTVPPESLEPQQVETLNDLVRIGLYTLFSTDQVHKYETAFKMLRVYKRSPERFVMTNTAIKFLAFIIIGYTEFSRRSVDLFLPLAFEPEQCQAILTAFLQDPEKNFPMLGRMVGQVEKLRNRIPDLFVSGARRHWEDIKLAISVGDQDQKYLRKKEIETLVTRSSRYNWDFVNAALAKV